MCYYVVYFDFHNHTEYYRLNLTNRNVEFSMKKIAIGNKKHMMKTMGVVLTLIFTVSLYAGGVFADTNCEAECCRQINPGGMHHTTGEPMKSLGDCRSNVPRIPCDLQSKQAVELPGYTLTSSGGGFLNHVGPMEISTGSSIDDNIFKPNCSVQPVWEKSQPPPIYLQKQSFLI